MSRGRIVAIVVALATVLALVLVIASGVLPYRVFIVHTGSMTPTIPSRSAVLVWKGHYRVGQVISFEEQHGVITHRLVKINADGTLVTRGDANSTDDPWTLPASAVIGGVIAAPKEAGYWLMYLKNPLGLLSILLSALICWQMFALAGWGADATRPATIARRQTARHRRRSTRHARPA